MKIKNLGSNKTEVVTGKWTVFFSYRTPVAAFHQTDGYFRTTEKFSVTTSKHINQWLESVKAKEKPQSFFENLTA